MAGSLFLRSIERSERVYSAMVARGFDGELRSLRTPDLGYRDLLIGLLFVFCLVLVSVLARLSW
jgi:cobalt/nickel transport system permease protein